MNFTTNAENVSPMMKKKTMAAGPRGKKKGLPPSEMYLQRSSNAKPIFIGTDSQQTPSQVTISQKVLDGNNYNKEDWKQG